MYTAYSGMIKFKFVNILVLLNIVYKRMKNEVVTQFCESLISIDIIRILN